MKWSWIIAVAVLAAGGVAAVHQHRTAAGVRAEVSKLGTEAAKLGIQVEKNSAVAAARLKRQRDESERKAASIAADLRSLAVEIDRLAASGREPDEEMHRRAMETMIRLMDLDAASISRLIAEMGADPSISDETRRRLISFSILTLADDHPEAAITLYAESSDMLGKDPAGGHVVGTALARWAEMDPTRALDWLRRHAGERPDLVDEEAKRSWLAGAAERDPALAFRMISELGLEDPTDAIHVIMGAGAGDDAERTEVLTALRAHLATITDPEMKGEMASKAFELLARASEGPDFDSLTQWMESVKFSPQEKLQFAGGLTWFTTRGDTGRWVEWLAGNLPADQLGDSVRELVGEWTQQDYLAAGQWLTQASESPAKSAAVEAYAAAVAEYEPQVAAQWALTLPPGPSREATLRAVYENWPASDPQGAAAFAREHGLE
jgi:hypothetical protein